MDEKRDTRRIQNIVSVYFRVISDSLVERVRDEIYHTVNPEDSFSFFMSLNRLDSSFDNLNKAFVLMMKQIDAKLNYIIDFLRDGKDANGLEDFISTYSCDISSGGISFWAEEEYEISSKIYMKIFLPIASHYAIKALGNVVGKNRKDGRYCYNVEFSDITNQDKELIIHYMIFVERKMAKNRINNE